MATKLDLKFDVQSSKQSELTSIFLVCDAYYVEICCQDNGHVASVKLAQANNQVDEHTVILSYCPLYQGYSACRCLPKEILRTLLYQCSAGA